MDLFWKIIVRAFELFFLRNAKKRVKNFKKKHKEKKHKVSNYFVFAAANIRHFYNYFSIGPLVPGFSRPPALDFESAPRKWVAGLMCYI
jgi:hypothetical protein